MGMINLLIALEVPKELNESIENLRKDITKKDKKNSYGNHESHITLFVNTFKNFSEVEKEVERIARKTKSFIISTKGAYPFIDDPLNIGCNTIVYKIEDNKELREIQKKLYERLSPLRTNHQTEWINKINSNLPKNLRKNVKKYGFPFGPEEYIHHASIGSITKKNYNNIWSYIKKKSIKKKWKVNYLTIYINLGDDGFRVYKRYKFKRK